MAELMTKAERRHYVDELSGSDCRAVLAYLAGRFPQVFDQIATEMPADQLTKGRPEEAAQAALDRHARRAETEDDTDDEHLPMLASLMTADGAWSVVETHTRPGGSDIDVIASYTAPGGRRPVLHGFRWHQNAWHRLAGEWTDLDTAREGVARATRLQVPADRRGLLFLDLALAGRTR